MSVWVRFYHWWDGVKKVGHRSNLSKILLALYNLTKPSSNLLIMFVLMMSWSSSIIYELGSESRSLGLFCLDYSEDQCLSGERFRPILGLLFLAHLSICSGWAFVSFCDRLPASGVRPHFQTTSPLKPLAWFHPNFVRSISAQGEQNIVKSL